MSAFKGYELKTMLLARLRRFGSRVVVQEPCCVFELRAPGCIPQLTKPERGFE